MRYILYRGSEYWRFTVALLFEQNIGFHGYCVYHRELQIQSVYFLTLFPPFHGVFILLDQRQYQLRRRRLFYHFGERVHSQCDVQLLLDIDAYSKSEGPKDPEMEIRNLVEKVFDANAIDPVYFDDESGGVAHLRIGLHGESTTSHDVVFWIYSIDVCALYVVLPKDVQKR